MKLTNKTFPFLMIILSTVIVSCEKNEDVFTEEGILLVEVLDSNTLEPVPNARIRVYRTLDDWAFEVNPGGTFFTDEDGIAIVTHLEEGPYHLDVSSDNRNNWQNPFPVWVMDGLINGVDYYISENINQVISTVDGVDWEITGVRDSGGNDLSSNPDYSCVIGNIATFEKAGSYFLRDEGTQCSGSQALTEGSWWAEGKETLYLLIHQGTDDGPVITLAIQNLQQDNFSGSFFDGTQSVVYDYSRR